MSSGLDKKIKLDFHDSKYISVNAKQFDKLGRYIEVTCTNHGEIVRIDRIKNYAFIRFRRIDGVGIILPCEVMNNGKVKIHLSKEMLDVAGKNYADLIFIETDRTRSPIADNGFFVVDYTYNEEDQSLTYEQYPTPNMEYEDGVLSVKSITFNGRTIQICSDPAPFVANDGNGNVVFAVLYPSGEIAMLNPSIVSTMNFCVNVIDSSFYGEVELMR